MATATPKGVINGNAAYSIKEAQALLSLGPAALRMARRNGLVVRRFGRKSFILGDDLLAYLRDHSKQVGPYGEIVG